ncbi:MAG TPA: glycoside hydrolase family 127 protein [Terriglobales bacterium]|nr:glycoside hydrolase family 127 protein [Terriglobales bacterium]
MTLGNVSRRKFMTGAAAIAGAAVLPSSANNLFAQDPVVDSIDSTGKPANRERVPWSAVPFPMKQVRLLEGTCQRVQEKNRQYLHSLPNDRLAHSFKITAGLPSSAEPFGGWEKPDSELRGHFNGGHYLSAVALMYASTGDEDLKKKGDALVSDLRKCQVANKNGYLSAFPDEFFDRLRERVRVWAPFYTIHKIIAGMLDMYVHTGNTEALQVAEDMAGWVEMWSGPLSYEHMQRVLGTEYGGMGEVLCNLYAVTGKRQYLGAARRFDKKAFFDPLANHRDELKGLHVNTHIPQVIAAARAYELTRDSHYQDIAQYFWDEVVSERSYCNGGTSNGEAWQTEPGKLSNQLGPSTTEDCCAYNMLKLTRHLFGWSPQARYMDYYERLVLNHRLGTMDPETGTTMYYYPIGVNLWKTYATATDSFWCCNGTGVEEFGKLNDTIYFHDDNSIYVNLYVPSEVSWPEKKLKLRQDTDFPRQQGTKLTLTVPQSTDVAIRLRIPYWANGGSVKINGRPVPVFSSPSSYLTLRGPWKNNDTIELNLPMELHSSEMPDDNTVQAPMYGPLVLAARHEEAPRDRWYGDTGPFEHRQRGSGPPPIPELPSAKGKVEDPSSWVRSAGNQKLAFEAAADSGTVALVPINEIVHERYDVYWKVAPAGGERPRTSTN